MTAKAFPVTGTEPRQEPLLPTPQESAQPQEWAEKAARAREARALGRKLRKGKRVLFSSGHHQAR